ncbi:MAG TPA: hypothetical protein VMB71_05655, partial [Acetobacteraceae bacterium]|nr:hypothetical protein [Acetobacteraceae bacterium]
NQFLNEGAVALQDSTLLVDDTTASVFQGLSLTNSTVSIVGELDATGATVDVGTGTALGDVTIGLKPPSSQYSSAAIFGGTIHDSGGGLEIFGNVQFADLVYQGVLTIAAPYTNVTVSNMTLEDKNGRNAGKLILSGAQSVLDVAAGTTLDNATVEIGSSTIRSGGVSFDVPRIEELGTGQPASLGASLIVDQTAKYAGLGANDYSSSFSSSATVDAAFAGGQMTLDGGTFINAGVIYIGTDESVTSAAASLANQGIVNVAGGGTLALNLLKFYQALPASGTSFDNSGTITLAGGTLVEQSGKSIPPVALRNDATGLIAGTGIIAAEVTNNGTVAATGGALTLSQAITGAGVLEVGATSTLSVLSSVSSGETAQFGGADGVLGLAPKSFLGEIGGFAAGDTIDLFKTSATAASFSGSSIVVTLSAGGTLTLHTTSALSGSLTVTGDGNGGSLIGFAGAPHMAAEIPVLPSTSEEPSLGGRAAWIGFEAQEHLRLDLQHHVMW